jgi:hypothetical protein
MRRKTGTCVALAGIAFGLMVLLPGCKSTGTQPDSSREPVRMDADGPASAPDQLSTDKSETRTPPEADIDLAVKFVPDRPVTYKVTTETEASVRWEGDASSKPDAFRGGAIGNHVEVTFEQRVDRVNDNGNATVKVTIVALKYLGRSRETVVLDFDSSRDRDREGPLSELIGKSYEVEMTPNGAVLSVDGAIGLRDAVKGSSPEHQAALKLISDKEIRDRHEVPALMASEGKVVHPGGTWSNVTIFSFGRMGAEAYERVYTLDRVEADGGDRIAYVTMKGIPSSAAARQLHQGQTDTLPSGMFDHVDTYEGRLHLDLDAGLIDTYVEQFHTEWVAVDQEAVQGGVDHPAAVRMDKTQLYRLERVP